MDKTDVYFDYGVTNGSDEPATGWWFQYTCYDPSGKEGTSRGSGLYEVPGGATEDRHVTADSYGGGIGRNRIHVRMHNGVAIYFEDDFYVDIEPPPAPPPTTGSLVVDYVAVSDQSPYTVTAYGNEIRVNYGVTNEGDVVASRYWVDYVVFDTDGGESAEIGELIADIPPGQTVDLHFKTAPRVMRLGTCRVHVRIFSETVTLFDDDVYVEITDDVPIM